VCTGQSRAAGSRGKGKKIEGGKGGIWGDMARIVLRCTSKKSGKPPGEEENTLDRDSHKRSGPKYICEREKERERNYPRASYIYGNDG
jgi:hypothetical protein